MICVVLIYKSINLIPSGQNYLYPSETRASESQDPKDFTPKTESLSQILAEFKSKDLMPPSQAPITIMTPNPAELKLA